MQQDLKYKGGMGYKTNNHQSYNTSRKNMFEPEKLHEDGPLDISETVSGT
jgi:hypothetical protein